MPAKFPSLYNFSTGRAYYGPSLKPTQKEYFTQVEETEAQTSDSSIYSTFKFGAAVGGIFASGFIPWKGGNLWDKYVGGLRALEEFSPHAMGRTLQLSNIFSPYQSSVREANLFIAPRLLEKNKLYTSYLAHLIGEESGKQTYQRLLQEGVTLRKGSLFWGSGEDIALRYASAIRAGKRLGSDPGEYGYSHIGAAYSRGVGFNPPNVTLQEFFARPEYKHFHDMLPLPTLEELPAQIIGGHTRLHAIGRKVEAYTGELVNRFNRLLETPAESFVFKTAFDKINEIGKTIGLNLSLSVEKGTALEMMGRLSLKYGVGLTALGLGYKTLDYGVRHTAFLDDTIFGEGITAAGATAIVQTNLFASKVADKFGLHDYREKQEEIAPGSTDLTKLLAFPMMGAAAPAALGYGYRVWKMQQLIRSGMQSPEARATAGNILGDWNQFGIKDIGDALTKKEGLYETPGIAGSLVRALAKPNIEGEMIYKGLGKLTPFKLAAVVGATVGVGLALPFWPGALIPSQRPEELEAIYSGKQDVAIRKGRWWTMGRSPYEGEKVVSFLPHWYPRLINRYREKAIWGETSEKEELSPINKAFKKEFTYELEKRQYRDRPYPITSLPFEDVPLIGGLLANTLGRIIKPQVLMHTEEWQDQQGGTKVLPGRQGEMFATDIGQLPMEKPINAYEQKQVLGEQLYRMQEMVGLPGFIGASVKDIVTGSQHFFNQKQQLESARRIAGAERNYWERELGDMFLTNEALRRLYPHRRREIPLYNPIENTQPSWIPGPQEKSIDFRHGDPYAKIPFGELRLPGTGYEARHPELQGIAAEDYPDIYKHRILADIAPYSDRYDLMHGQIRAQRKSKDWTQDKEAFYQTTLTQLKAQKKGKEFSEYQYLGPTGGIGEGHRAAITETQAIINRQLASQQQKPSIWNKFFGGYWEALSHNAETAADQLTPFAPGAKFVHQRTAIESYETEQVYGTKAAFWDRPIENFIKPFASLLGKSVGITGVPDRIKDRRELEEYFDILEYTKASRLANTARLSRDYEAVKEFEQQKNQTMFGISPYTMNYTNLMNALPRRDRDYFESFATAKTDEERNRIMRLVPENEQTLYQARWELLEANNIKKAQKAGLLTEQQSEIADKEVEQIYQNAANEGLPNSAEMNAEYLKTRVDGENYPDWYRRVKLLAGKKLPGADWVGWHPSVDLEDIKMKVVQTMGEDMHDYDLWESREQQMQYKPYIDEESIAPIINEEQMDSVERRNRVNELLLVNDMKGHVSISKGQGRRDNTRIEIEHDRTSDIVNSIRKTI